MKKWTMYLAVVCALFILITGCQPDPTPGYSDNSASESGDDSTVSVDSDEKSAASADSAEASSETADSYSATVSSSASVSSKPNNTGSSSSASSRVLISVVSQPTSGSGLSMFPVTPKYTIQQSAQKVNNQLTSAMTKIPSVVSQLQDYDPDYNFTHHPGMAIFKGKLYVSYSKGYAYEDTPGQHAVVTSIDVDKVGTGKWSDPVTVGPARKLPDGKEAFCINGFLFATDDRLFCYYMDKEYGPDAYDAQGNYITTKYKHPFPTVANYGMMTFTTDGVNWSEPMSVGIAANESPRQSLTGQWFAGSGNKLIYSNKEKPNGVFWDYVGMTEKQYQASLNRGALQMLTEASWYQTDDYIIHQMLRSHDGYVWMSESYDNGKTWTEAYATKFTSDTTMANFGRLPDGRIYFVGNADRSGERYPLHLYVSEDGYNFSTGYILRDEPYTVQNDNWTKYGYYGYPEVLIEGDYMYVVYSRKKEIMEVTRVKLSDIR